MRRRRASALANRGRRSVQLLLLATNQHQPWRMLGEPLRHALPDSAAGRQ